jgi:hypothetical protein
MPALTMAFSLHIMPFLITLLLMVGFLYTHGCICLFERMKKKDIVCDFLFDGQYIIFGVLISVLFAIQTFLHLL